MLNLLNSFSLQEIVVMGAAIFLAAFEIYKVWKEMRKDAETSHTEYYNRKKREEEIEQRILACERSVQELKKNQDYIMQQNQLLTESDKIRIKAEIVKQHHYFCYKIGWIDEYSLDTLERQYAVYICEGGNSFVESLMEDIRHLPLEEITNSEEK